MASKASQMHFALILVKGADEAWFGQRLPSRNPVHHTRSKMASSSMTTTRNNGSQPAMAEIARERTLLSISGQNKTRENCDAKTVSIHDRIQQFPGEKTTINERREVVLSGMPRNSVYKEEYFNYTLGFKETWK